MAHPVGPDIWLHQPAHSTPPLPVPPPAAVCAPLPGDTAPSREGLEYLGAINGQAIWATPGALACSEPALGAVECFAAARPIRVRIENEHGAVGYDLRAREALRIGPKGVSCSAPPDAPAEPIATEPAPDMNAVHTAIAGEAQRLYGAECVRVTVPERAIVPVELTGGGHPEYAVFFARVQCAVDGASTTRWQGTGGAMMQFWLASGGAPRLLLEHSMMGFSPADEFAGLITHQHGGYCPDGAGPNICKVIYRWNDRDRALEAAQRTALENRHDIDRSAARLRFGYDEVSRW